MENIVRRRPTADPATPNSRGMRCAFTGYRPQKMPFGFNELDPRCLEFKNRLRNTIEMLIWEGYAHFLSGGALGMDMYAAETVLELRQEYPWIGLEIVVPYESQADNWAEPYQVRYNMILDAADIITCTGHEYTKGALFRRNRYLVDNADLLLAAYDGQPGGTQMTCDYARKAGVPVCLIRPEVKKTTAPVREQEPEDDLETEELLKGTVLLFQEVRRVNPEKGKNYSIDCPFCNSASAMSFALSAFNSHLHASCNVCSAAIMQ